MSLFKKILVPVDGSDTSRAALATALRMARDAAGSVLLIHSLDELAYLTGYEYSGAVMSRAREDAESVLGDAAKACETAGVHAETRLLEKPGERLGETIADAARQWQADLIVVGTHGRRGLGRVLLGSGAEQIIRMSPIPVLTIRSPAKAS